MTMAKPSFDLPVEVSNPGQFFACCGVLELAHRLAPGALGWFSEEAPAFCVYGRGEAGSLKQIVNKLVEVGIEGELTSEERNELLRLEKRKRTLAKNPGVFPETDEERRTQLGKRLREGALRVGNPFDLRLDWWQEQGDDVPKTFAGKQEVFRMARAMLAEILSALDVARPLERRSLLKAVKEGNGVDGSEKRKKTAESKVEPFYFDAARFAHALDVGFSLDAQEKNLRATAAPITELLALIGLQRFRPKLTGDWTFDYFTWHKPLGATVSAAVASGAVPMSDSRGYRFRLRFRDDQKRYKAFGFAVPMEVDQ
jgi:CRISPR-associated protein Csb3